MLEEERKILLKYDFDLGHRKLPAHSYVDATKLNGVTLVRAGFGDYRVIANHLFDEDDLKEILENNTHLVRSDLL